MTLGAAACASHDRAALRTRVLRPAIYALGFERVGPARDLDAFDEPDAPAWWTPRAPSPADVALGACAGEPEPAPPFVALRAKPDGATPGLEVRDARDRRYYLKLDQLPREQPELSTAADVIVSRLYWAVGYHVPCNRVLALSSRDLRAGTDPSLTTPRLAALLARGTPLPDGRVRAGASLVVPGTPLGPWSGDGVRADDPDDAIAHEHRRVLRAERLLAAWVNRWDVRDANALDAREAPAPGAPQGRVRHYMLDFGDALGAYPLGGRPREYMGHRHAVDPGVGLVDALTLGQRTRPWRGARLDPRAPALGYFDATRFDPGEWVASEHVLRFSLAQAADLGWMARRIARLGPAHVRAAVRAGQLHDVSLEARLLEVLLARRARLLAWTFARSSPLDDLIVRADGPLLCATDLAAKALGPGATARYAAVGDDGRGPPRSLVVSTDAMASRVCVALESAPTRVVIERTEATSRTRLTVTLAHGAQIVGLTH